MIWGYPNDMIWETCAITIKKTSITFQGHQGRNISSTIIGYDGMQRDLLGPVVSYSGVYIMIRTKQGEHLINCLLTHWLRYGTIDLPVGYELTQFNGTLQRDTCEPASISWDGTMGILNSYVPPTYVPPTRLDKNTTDQWKGEPEVAHGSVYCWASVCIGIAPHFLLMHRGSLG